MAANFQTIRNIRGAFRLALFWISIFVITYSWYSWQTVKEAETNQLSLLAELESKSIESLFAHFETHLSLLSQELLGTKASMESESVHLLLRRIQVANPDLANIIIERPDGQIIASATNPPGTTFPTYAKESSFNAGRDALLNGADYDIGRPTYGKLINEWVMPLRFAIRDLNGKLIYIIAAPLPLSRQQSFWKSLYLPTDAVLGLLRDDGYLLSLYPSPAVTEQESAYNKPGTGVTMKFLKEQNFPINGVVEGISNRNINSIVAMRRLSRYPVTLFVAVPLSYIRSQWWKNNQAFYFLFGISLLSGYGIYLWFARRQEEWEVEREAANQKIIDANHAKDQAEKELLALELDDVKLALDHHSIVSIADVSGNISYVNEKFCEVSGYTSEELVGQNHRQLNSGLHARQFFTELWQTITSGQIWHGQIRNKAKDGSQYWVDSTIVPFLNKDGKPYQYVSVSTDVTAFIQARAAAEEANKTKSQFLSSMSHELRTPLNAILGFSQVLELQIEPEQKEPLESVAQIMTAGYQLLGLINDLLDLSRIEVGKLDFDIQTVSIAELASSSVSIVLASLAGEQNITVENTIMDNRLLVRGDSLRIRQVLINLLSNAVKYNSEYGSVTLSSLIQADGKLRIQVKDSGDGIDSDKIPLLFKHFERIDQKHGKIKGAGIGLYVCKQLVEAMQGEVGVESIKGQGSTFWFTLPLGDDGGMVV